MIIATAACYLAWFGVISFFDPDAGGILVLLFFYALLTSDMGSIMIIIMITDYDYMCNRNQKF